VQAAAALGFGQRVRDLRARCAVQLSSSEMPQMTSRWPKRRVRLRADRVMGAGSGI